MKTSISNTGNPIKRKRRTGSLGILEVLFVFGLPFGSLFLSFLIFQSTGFVGFWNIPGELGLFWLPLAGSFLAVTRTIGEFSFKNSYTDKQLSKCAIFSFFASAITSAMLWLTAHLCKYTLALLPVIVEFLLYFVLLTLTRFIFLRIEFHKKQRILIIAEREESLDYAAKLIRRGNKKDSIRALFIDDASCDEAFIKSEIEKCDIVCFGKHMQAHLKNIFVAYATAEERKRAYIVPNSYEILTGQSVTSNLGDTMTMEARPLELNWFQNFVKRSFDVIVSFLSLIIFSPLIGIVALAIHLQDGGPAIYKQERITRHGKTFMLYKFRSMVVDAEKKTGAVLMTSDDNRLTKVGKFVRKTRLDELPQLWNILKGDMSIVGPRPERPVFVKQFLEETPEYRYRLNVRAGLSGYAQIMGTYNTKYTDKLRWDLMYISKYSFALDIWILLKTALAVFDKESAAGLENLNGFEFIQKCGRKYECDSKHLHVFSVTEDRKR